MSTFFRILVILTIATLIGGVMYFGVNASVSSSYAGLAEGTGSLQPPEGDESRLGQEDQGELEGGFGFPAGMIEALLFMSVAGSIYFAVTRKGKKAKQATAN